MRVFPFFEDQDENLVIVSRLRITNLKLVVLCCQLLGVNIKLRGALYILAKRGQPKICIIRF